jgi:hypothetical protein
MIGLPLSHYQALLVIFINGEETGWGDGALREEIREAIS